MYKDSQAVHHIRVLCQIHKLRLTVRRLWARLCGSVPVEPLYGRSDDLPVSLGVSQLTPAFIVAATWVKFRSEWSVSYILITVKGSFHIISERTKAERRIVDPPHGSGQLVPFSGFPCRTPSCQCVWGSVLRTIPCPMP